MLNTTAIYAISLYQRHLSPYKGFRCAYRAHTGRCSCSEYAKKIVRRLGVFALFVAMPRQFSRCRLAYHAIMAIDSENNRRNRRRQRRDSSWDCSGLDCGGCDINPFSLFNHKPESSHCDLPLDGCDIGPCDCSF